MYTETCNTSLHEEGVGGMGGALLNPAAVPKETERRFQITASADVFRGAKHRGSPWCDRRRMSAIKLQL